MHWLMRGWLLVALGTWTGGCSSEGAVTAGASTTGASGDSTGNDSTGSDTGDDSTGSDTGDGDGDGDGDGPATTFVETDGFVVMETESIAIPDGHEWERRDSLSDHTGDGYYAFLGNRICNGPAGSPLVYDFTITSRSRFELRLRMTKIFHCAFGTAKANGHCESKGSCDRAGAPNDEDVCTEAGTCLRDDLSNDVFVHVEDAEGNYVAWKDQPGDTLGDPIKLFVGGGQTDTWRWTGTASLDVNHQKWDAHWDLEPGAYALVLQGRSQLTRVDRMVFFDQQSQSFSGDDATAMDETR